MDLGQLRKNWDLWGRSDPLYAILTESSKRGGKWDLPEFFRSGESEIADLMRCIDSLGFSIKRETALDFGCGVGRLTQALCSYFNVCYGVDIAPSMIALANKYNRYGERCRYLLNDTDDLRFFDENSFDLVCSKLVLQHMEPEYSKNYIKEFLRVLQPHGLIVFQLPAERNALPDAAFMAEVSIDKPAIVTGQGAPVTVVVSIKNASDVVWPQGGMPVHLGNHWLNNEGKMLVWDDERIDLPETLNPKGEVKLSLTTRAPSDPGEYVLELDLVQEGVAWFKEKGSKTARVLVNVLESRPGNRSSVAFDLGTGSQGAAPEPLMEFYGIPKNEVAEFLASHGGLLVHVHEDRSQGLSDVTYYVTK
jgi:SAM-dependent methyltransferase